MQRRGALTVAAAVSILTAGATVAGAAVGPMAVLGFGKAAEPSAELSWAVDATPTTAAATAPTGQTVVQLRYVDTYVQLPATTTTVRATTTLPVPTVQPTTSAPALAVQRAQSDAAAALQSAGPTTGTAPATPTATTPTTPSSVPPVAAPPSTAPRATQPTASPTTLPRPVTTTRPEHDDDHDDDHEDERFDEDEDEDDRFDDRDDDRDDDRPVPPLPANCRRPHLEDDGWECED